MVFRLSAVYIGNPPDRLLFYSFTSDELTFIKLSKLVIAHEIKFHAPAARETINFNLYDLQIKNTKIQARLTMTLDYNDYCLVNHLF